MDKFKHFNGPHNGPALEDFIADIVRRVKALEAPRTVTSSGSATASRIPAQLMSVADFTAPSISVTSATFVAVGYAHLRMQQNQLGFEVRTKFNVAASTSAEARIVDNDTNLPLSDILAITGAAFGYYDLVGTFPSYVELAAKTVRIEARRSVGSGPVGVTIAWAYGKGA